MSETAYKVDALREIVLGLSDEAIQAVYDFAAFLADRQKRHQDFVQKVLSAEREPTRIYDSAEQYMQSIQTHIDEIQD